MYGLATPAGRDAAYPALLRKFRDTIRNVPEDQRRVLGVAVAKFHDGAAEAQGRIAPAGSAGTNGHADASRPTGVRG